jgi:hypothetical protein
MHSLSEAIWRSRRVAFALCSISVVGCLGDTPSTSVNSLQGQGGNAGSGGGSGESGAPNTAGDGGSSGSGFGGSASTAGGSAGSVGSAGSAGSAGAGAAGEPDAGGAISEPDAGEPVDPGEDPEDEAVLFSDVFPLLVAECGNCHGANAPGARPRFAIANNEAASFAATQLMAQGQLVSTRIVVRAVTARTMPTGCNGGALGTGSCLSQDQADLLEQWVEDGAQP